MTRMSNKCPTEYQEQIKLAEYLDMKGYCWCHVPNEGKHKVQYRAKQKRMGLKAGVPDVLIFCGVRVKKYWAGNKFIKYNGIAIELKRKKGGQLQDSQKEWLKKLSDRGWLTKVCHGADEAIDWLEGLEV